MFPYDSNTQNMEERAKKLEQQAGKTRTCRALCTSNGKQEDNRIITCILKNSLCSADIGLKRLMGQEAQEELLKGWRRVAGVWMEKT